MTEFRVWRVLLVLVQCCVWRIRAECGLDILFVVDASSSLRGTFEKTLDLLRGLEELLVIREDAHRVGLIEYSGPTRNWVELPIGFAKDNEAYRKRLDRLLYLQGTTLTGKALNTAHKLWRDARSRNKMVMVVVTDGYSHDDVNTPVLNIQRTLPDLQTYVVVVKPNFREDEVNRIAGDPRRVIHGSNIVEEAKRALRPTFNCNAPRLPVTPRTQRPRATPAPPPAPPPSPPPRRTFKPEFFPKPPQPLPLLPPVDTYNPPPPTPRRPYPFEPNPTDRPTTTPGNENVKDITKTQEKPTPLPTDPNGDPVCDRLPFQTTCATGFKSQFTLRFYYDTAQQRCCAYPWGYCKGEHEIATHPSIRKKEDCEDICGR